MRPTGSRRRRAIGLFATTAVLIVLFIPFGSGTAGAQTITHTFPAVDCLAVVNGQTLHQPTDITVSITAPDSVTPGQTFTVTFPGGSALLPNSSNGLTITQYSNLSTTFQINGTTFTSGTIVNPGTATLVPTAGGATQNIVVNATLPATNQIKIAEPGPFPPGTLTLPDISVSAVAPASGSVTLNAAQLTTTVKLNGIITAAATCNIPATTIVTIPVTAATTTTTAATTSTTGATTTTTGATTTTTGATTTTTGGTTSTTGGTTSTTGATTSTTGATTTT